MRQTKIPNTSANGEVFLFELFQHCDGVPFTVKDKAAVPVFDRRKEGVSAVVLVARCRSERNVVCEVFEILRAQAFDSFAVEFVPCLKIFKAFAFVLHDEMGMAGTERIPDGYLFVHVAAVAVFDGVFDHFAYLLFKQIQLSDFRRRGLNDEERKIPDLSEIRRKRFYEHIFRIE